MSQKVSLEIGISSPSAIVAKDSTIASRLPDDLLRHALSFLSPEDLARASGVCREWNKLSSDLWKDFDLKKICKVIDQAVWEKHVDLTTWGLDASGAPAIDKRFAVPFLTRLGKQVEGDAGVTLLTMPKGLTLNKLIALALAPKQGPATLFTFIWSIIVEEIGNSAIDKTYVVAITNSVLKNSRKMHVGDQLELAQKNGGELPGFLQAATLSFLTYTSSPEGQPPLRLYGDRPWTNTRCSDKIRGYGVIIGSYFEAGLYANASISDGEIYGAGVAKLL